MNEKFYNIVEKICEQDPRYHRDAYFFLMEALGYTQKKCNARRHVSGQELLSGIKDYLLEQFGPMTITVLKQWRIDKTEDFGNIVFNLVENNALMKTEEDNIEHFKNVYDFEEVFLEGYRKTLHKQVRQMKDI